MASLHGSSPYRPLSPADTSEIRIVKLYAAHQDEIPRCEIEHVSVAGQNTPPYITLSYVWGDPNETTDINLNGQSFPVTTNLASFLRHMQVFMRRVFQATESSPWLAQLLDNPRFTTHTLLNILNDDYVPLDFMLDTQLSQDSKDFVLRHVNQAASLCGLDPKQIDETEPIQASRDLDQGFWIDADCINQTDLMEKTHQIGQMSTIYTKASGTVIYMAWRNASIKGLEGTSTRVGGV